MKGGREKKGAKTNWSWYLTFAYGDLGELGWAEVGDEWKGRFPG